MTHRYPVCFDRVTAVTTARVTTPRARWVRVVLDRLATVSGSRGDDYPGQRFGLPESGTGSTASWGRRVLALFVDWFACLGVTALVGQQVEMSETATRLSPLLVLLVELTLLVGLLGRSLGHRLLSIRVARLDGRPVGVPHAALRSALICLVVPAVVFDKDRRGLHDLATGTVVIAA